MSFWAFAVIENEDFDLKVINDDVIDKLIEYLASNIDAFGMVRSSFSTELYNRYVVTAKFFTKLLDTDFNIYLNYNAEFKELIIILPRYRME